MFSPELENLIQATLADGILEENEKMALIKRAQKEGVDLAELDIYINSILQKQVQNETIKKNERMAAHEKERRGNVCPHCGTPIPPLTKLCPNCGQAVNSNETSGDKELFELIDKINNAIVDVKSATNSDDYNYAKAKCESLLRKADMFYGENKKVQMLKEDMLEELESARIKFRNDNIKSGVFGVFKIVFGVFKKLIALLVLGALILLGISFWCIPFISSGFRSAIGTQWDKVFG